MNNNPVLYSFRRCPFAIRARMALYYAGITVEIREVVLKDKPQQMLAASPKGTVPVMVLPEGTVLEESLDIMLWALQQNDPDNWLPVPLEEEVRKLIDCNDFEFKANLDKYKYADRHPEHPPEEYRQRCEKFLLELEQRLTRNKYLLRESISLVDVAIFPFIRQFAMVDWNWFQVSPYLRTLDWLEVFLENVLFKSVMQKIQQWQQGDNPTLLITAV